METCDSCGVRARFMIVVDSPQGRALGVLTFCAHHHMKHAPYAYMRGYRMYELEEVTV